MQNQHKVSKPQEFISTALLKSCFWVTNRWLCHCPTCEGIHLPDRLQC